MRKFYVLFKNLIKFLNEVGKRWIMLEKRLFF